MIPAAITIVLVLVIGHQIKEVLSAYRRRQHIRDAALGLPASRLQRAGEAPHLEARLSRTGFLHIVRRHQN